MNFANRAAELSDWIVAHRRHIHQHPELSFQEHGTTAYLVSELEKLGIPVQTFSDYTGCIAVIRGGRPGRTVMLRADIDALPIQECSGVSFESQNPGVMHACGHDCHSSMLLGAARLLQEQRESLQGTVKLLFQAAEEAFLGSHYYWNKGFLSDVDAAMGMHVWPTVPSGKLCIQDGPLMSSCDNFKITVHGVSAHGSEPNHGRDAIVAASAIICNLQTIVSRMNDPHNSLVVTVSTVQAGSQFNIIADTAVLTGTIRTHLPQTRAAVKENMRQITEITAQAMGCTADLEYTFQGGPVINSDAALNAIARGAAKKLYGSQVLTSTPLVMSSEDFYYFMEHIPSSVFAFLGCYDEAEGCIYPVHNEKFKINEAILSIGAAQYAQFAADYLEQTAGGEGK